MKSETTHYEVVTLRVPENSLDIHFVGDGTKDVQIRVEVKELEMNCFYRDLESHLKENGFSHAQAFGITEALATEISDMAKMNVLKTMLR